RGLGTQARAQTFRLLPLPEPFRFLEEPDYRAHRLAGGEQLHGFLHSLVMQVMLDDRYDRSADAILVGAPPDVIDCALKPVVGFIALFFDELAGMPLLTKPLRDEP